MGRPKGSKNKPSNKNNKKQDLHRLAAILRLIMDRLEQAIVTGDKELKAQHEWIFGDKKPVAETLKLMAELLAKVEPEGVRTGRPPKTQEAALSKTDVALLKAYVKRMQKEFL